MTTAVLTAAGSATASFSSGYAFAMVGTGRLAFRSVPDGRASLQASGHGDASWTGLEVVAPSASIRSAGFAMAGGSTAAFASGLSGPGAIAVSVGRALSMTVTVGKPYGVTASMRAV